MTESTILDKPVSDITVRDLVHILKSCLELERADRSREGTVHGIKGLAKLFGVSESTAKRIKSSGVINRAICQKGRTIIVDSDLALALYAKSCGNRIGFKH